MDLKPRIGIVELPVVDSELRWHLVRRSLECHVALADFPRSLWRKDISRQVILLANTALFIYLLRPVAYFVLSCPSVRGIQEVVRPISRCIQSHLTCEHSVVCKCHCILLQYCMGGLCN